MSPAEWLRAGWRAWLDGGWGVACPEGTPVPDEGGCADCDSVRLSALRPGESAIVSCLEEPGSRATAKLFALGVLPGARVLLLQRYPGFVFRMGHSELAVDAELAGRIRVRREI
jgi:DtxR family Mn-dependent transcriptional regulator